MRQGIFCWHETKIIISAGISPFITIIIQKYEEEYTRLSEARRSVNVQWGGRKYIEFEWL